RATQDVPDPARSAGEPGSGAIQRDAAAAEHRQRCGGDAVSNPKILIIDDDKALVTLLSHELREAGYQVVVALDPVQGMMSAKREAPELVLLDVVMTGRRRDAASGKAPSRQGPGDFDDGFERSQARRSGEGDWSGGL